MSLTSQGTTGQSTRCCSVKDRDFAREYSESFIGMTREPVELSILVEARALLRKELLRRLTGRQKQFLIGPSRAQPDWSLLLCPYSAELPALRWKLANLETFRKRRAEDFEQQAKELEEILNR